MRRTKPPTYALRPINPDNTRGLRITAAAGTKLATPYSPLTINQCSALYECSNRLIALPACRLPIGRQGRQACWVVGYIHFQQFQQLEHITQCEALASVS